MADAYRDGNDVPTLIASSNVDGRTPVRLYADPVTHRLLVDVTGGTGSITVTDGITTVTSVTELNFTSGATITDLGGGIVGIAISGGGSSIAVEGPLTVSGGTQVTVTKVPFYMVVNGIQYFSNHWSRSGPTVTFDTIVSGAEVFNVNLGVAIPISTGTFEVPTGTVDGSNTSFVFATAPSVVVIDGIAKQKTNSDGTVNWTGTTTIAVTSSPNFDIFGFDNSDSSYQQPTGTVDGSNTSFTFSVAPNVIVVDGVTLKKTSSDGTVNWTGTTAVTLSFAPNFDVFSFGGLTTYEVPSGSVNGSNTSFTYSSTPVVIIIDNEEKRKISSDGTVNWTGTTSVSLVVAPNFDIFTP